MKKSWLTIWAVCAAAGAVSAAETASLRALGGAFAGVYERVAPSVVVLEITKKDTGSAADRFAWELLFRNQPGAPGRPPAEESEGSGFVIREDGHILTNAHVIEGADPEKGVVARRQDGTRLPLKVVGVDEKTDLAVLKADLTGMPAVEWGDSDAVRVGEFVCGIGAPFELDYTLTAGVISAKGRSNLTSTVYEDYLQTDAAINPGNSGGPLCDLDGRVVGVNTLINGLSRGLSFAIPSQLARKVSDELIANGRVVRPWLGIRIETLSETPGLQEMMGIEQGVVVRTIEPGAPAARSKLQPADVIVAVDGQPVTSARELQQSILRKAIGQKVDLKVWRRALRGGKFETIPVTTEELPRNPLVAGTPERRPPREPAEGREMDTPFGLAVEDLSAEVAGAMGLEPGGVIVTNVEGSGPAALAGLQRRDVITAVGPAAVANQAAFEEALAALPEGESAVLLVERDGKKTYAILRK
ncbi:MAG: trypsin-like peptidase domain-containing protein [Chthoniobacterales bacterium]